MNTPTTPNHDTSALDAHRRVNGQFGPQPRAELAEQVHLTTPPAVLRVLAAPAMPGLNATEVVQWRDLDALIENSYFSADALTTDEAASYGELCTKVDAAVAAGEDGWLPDCPVHKDREGPGEWDRWGKDFRCRVCVDDTTPGSLRIMTVNRLGLRDKHAHPRAVFAFSQHLAELDRAADIRREAKRRLAARQNESVAPEAV